MKKIYILLLSSSLFTLDIFAQSMQASIGPGTAAAGAVNAIIYMKAINGTGTTTETISTLDINVGLPEASFTVAPTLTITSNVFGVPWLVEPVKAEGGFWNYHIYKSLDPLPIPFDYGIEKAVMVVQLTGGTPAITTPTNLSLVSLGDAGSNGFLAFVYTGNISAAGGNLYYSRPTDMGYITTATNGDTYRPTSINSTTGTFTSTATIGVDPLPVKFVGFTAIKKDNNALLTWQIENESAITDRYEVERSVNGADFKKAYTVQSKNNGNTRNTYDLADLNLSAIRSSGVLYYRVKQIDKDGRFVYTDIKSVRLTSKGLVIGLYPNPVKGVTNITIDAEQNADAVVTLHDAAGKLLRNIQMQLFKGPNIKKIDMESLAAGSYMLRVQTATETTTIPVVKTN